MLDDAGSMLRCVPVLALLAALASGCGGNGNAQRYTTRLAALNGSGVHGSAQLTLGGRDLAVRIVARGLTAHRIHEQRLEAGAASSAGGGCAQGGQSNRLGPVVMALQPYPTVGSDGRLRYTLTFTVDPGKLQPLAQRTLVLYGRTARSSATGTQQYFPETPVACGTLRKAG